MRLRYISTINRLSQKGKGNRAKRYLVVGLIDIHIFVQNQSREELKANYLLSIF
jgi:hypothetical protein